MNITNTTEKSLALTNFPLFVEEIGKELPGDWVVTKAYSDDSNPERMHLTRSDGVRLYLSNSRNWGKNGKMSIMNSAPVGKDGRNFIGVYHNGNKVETTHKIYVSESKSPAQIAKDIVKRLLTEAENIHKLTLVQIERNEQEANKKLDTIYRLNDILLSSEFKDDKRANISLHPGGGNWDYSKGYGNAVVNDGGETVEFELSSIPADKAVELTSWLKSNLFT